MICADELYGYFPLKITRALFYNKTIFKNSHPRLENKKILKTTYICDENSYKKYGLLILKGEWITHHIGVYLMLL